MISSSRTVWFVSAGPRCANFKFWKKCLGDCLLLWFSLSICPVCIMLQNQKVKTIIQVVVLWGNNYLVGLLNVKHNAVDALLKLLLKPAHSDLLTTTRRLMGNMQAISITNVPGVECVELDVKQRILEHLQSDPSTMMNALNILEIYLNMDGLLLFKSKIHVLLPVLCSINLIPVSVFPLSLRSKPNSWSGELNRNWDWVGRENSCSTTSLH